MAWACTCSRTAHLQDLVHGHRRLGSRQRLQPARAHLAQQDTIPVPPSCGGGSPLHWHIQQQLKACHHRAAAHMNTLCVHPHLVHSV